MISQQKIHFLLTLGAILLTQSCTNNPHESTESQTDTYFSSFSSEPTKLDPTSAYYAHEGRIIDQIYEPPFTYHYLKRPYQVIPLTAKQMPTPVYFDSNNNIINTPDPLPEQVSRVEYTIKIKSGIMYQNHPCFAVKADKTPYYKNITPEEIKDFDYPSEFPQQGTRELIAADYVLQIRRLADPRLASPVLSAMVAYISDLDNLSKTYKNTLKAERTRRKDAKEETNEKQHPIRLDYMEPDFMGAKVIDKYTYKIILKKKYPQIIYWMCMHFFAPVPIEAVNFFSEQAITTKGLSINRCPIGTGPYYMETFKPNERIILQRNPNYHDDFYPNDGAQGDKELGLLVDAGKTIPFISKQVYTFEKETLPAWNKFLQGYYDASGINDDSFDQAIDVRTGEDPDLSGNMKQKGIQLITATDTTLWYTSFNMLDPLVGGYTEDKCKLRQAISIALDYNEYLDIFANGRGVLAQGPLPPGIFGYREGTNGVNPYVDRWDTLRKRRSRKSMTIAKQLLAEAGYPNGRDAEGRPLTIFYDHSQSGSSSFRAYYIWQRDRLKSIGIIFEERPTDLSQYRKKRVQGNWQVSSGGWLADYPDPENFMFLFYGPNGKVKNGGPNATNYKNKEYDAFFIQMESMLNSPQRQLLIDKMTHIIQHDAPAVWQYHPVSYSLQHQWYKNVKPHQMCYNVMKYRRIDGSLRADLQKKWNKPVLWPLAIFFGIILLSAIPAVVSHRKEC